MAWTDPGDPPEAARVRMQRRIDVGLRIPTGSRQRERLGAWVKVGEGVEPWHSERQQRLALAVHHQLKLVDHGVRAERPAAHEHGRASTDRNLGWQWHIELYVQGRHHAQASW